MYSDEELVRLVRRGEHRAFDELYRRYNRRLYTYIVRMTRDRNTAEELLQEVFLTVLRADTGPLRPHSFAGWLFTVARNRCVSHLRREGRRGKKAEGVEPDQVDCEQMTALDVEDQTSSPEALAERNQQVQGVARALSELSSAQQEVLLLKSVGGLTYAQIAQVQGVAEGTAKSRLHHAVRSIRNLLRSQEE